MGWQCRAPRAQTAVAALGFILVSTAPVLGADSGPRQVLGTLAVQGEVRVQQASETGTNGTAVVGKQGGPLLERTVIRTSEGGAALLTLTGTDGVVGLRAGATLRTGARERDGLRMDLVSGEALIRLPAGSHLSLETSTASIRADALIPASTGPVRASEASVRVLADGRTVVRVETGNVRVEGRSGPAALVKAGEEATVAHDAAPKVVAASSASPPVAPANEDDKKVSAGIFGVDPMVAGLALAGVGVTAGVLGGLGASGNLGNGSSHDSETSPALGGGGGPAGSPFRTSR
jgi:hypothetical protein